MHIMKITHPTCNLVHNINHRETCDETPLGGFNNHFGRFDFISSIITKEWMFSLVVVLHPINLVILGWLNPDIIHASFKKLASTCGLVFFLQEFCCTWHIHPMWVKHCQMLLAQEFMMVEKFPNDILGLWLNSIEYLRILLGKRICPIYTLLVLASCH